MWFDEIMDDFKLALKISNENKGIFVPIFLKLAFSVITFIFLFVVIIGTVARFVNISNIPETEILSKIIPQAIIFAIIGYFLFLLFGVFLEVGSISVCKIAVEGEKPKMSHFFEGVKRCFLKVLGGKLLLLVIFLVLSPIIIVLYLLYAAIVGILSGGWGLIFLSVLVMVFLSFWTTIVVVDNFSPVEAIKRGIRIGKKYFWALFLVMLSTLLVTRFMTAAFGPVITVFAGWFVSGIVSTYFKVVLVLIYNRKKELCD